MQAIAYVRVSTEEQVSGTSLNSQVEACQNYAKSHGLTLSKNNIFREEGESAKFANRPELIKMLDACRTTKSITHCIVWKVDRLARDFKIHAAIKVQLAKYDVKLVSVTEPISDDPMGQAMEGILAVFSQLDNDVRTLRTTGGMRARTLQGGWPHSSPTGYKTAKTPSDITTLEPSDMAPTVTNFLNEFSTGAYTVKQAATLAYDMGIRSRKGKKLYWQSVHNIIANPIYMGWIKTKYTDGEMIKGLHPALISEKTYYTNQAILSGKTHGFSREAVEDWPMRGFVKHTCGKAMTGSSPTGRSGPSPRYSCPVCKAKVVGKQVSKQRHLVHEEFVRFLDNVRPTEGAAKLFKEIVLRQWNDEFKHGLQLSSRLDEEMAALMQKKSRIIDLFIDGK